MIVTVVRVVAISDCDTADIVRCSEIHRPPRMSGVHAGTWFSVIATINSQTCHGVLECAALAGRLLPCHVFSWDTYNHNPLWFYRITKTVTSTGLADSKTLIAHGQDHGIRILSWKSSPHSVFAHDVSYLLYNVSHSSYQFFAVFRKIDGWFLSFPV